MSFREKSTWITFILLMAFGIYFGAVFWRLYLTGAPPINFPRLFMILVAVFILVEIVMHGLLAYRSPKDARKPMDERERSIALHSIRPAFYVLLIGSFLSIGMLHLRANAWTLAHAVLLAIWIAELTRYGVQLYHYRRGA